MNMKITNPWKLSPLSIDKKLRKGNIYFGNISERAKLGWNPSVEAARHIREIFVLVTSLFIFPLETHRPDNYTDFHAWWFKRRGMDKEMPLGFNCQKEQLGEVTT